MLQAYLIYFDVEIMKIQADILQLHNETEGLLNQEINKILQANGYDFYDYSDEITILVDDQGFNKSLNPVFEIISSFGDISQLMGRLLFVRNVENEYSTDIGGLSMQDIYEIRDSIDIKLLGITKGD